jgi:uncharacterized phage-associated protein
MLTCRQVADYFLALFNNDEAGELISNLKLQKLVYYAQALYLAKYNKPLFENEIEAWAYGYVVPELYKDFKQHGANAIPPPVDFNYSIYDPSEQEILEEVYLNYGQYSAWRLSQITHEEALWNKYKMGENNCVVPKEEIKKYFQNPANSHS